MKPQEKDTVAADDAIATQAGEVRLPALRYERPAPPRSSAKLGHRAWLWGAAAILTGAVGLALLLYPWAAGPALVAVETASLTPVTRVLAVNGRIAAAHSVDVRSLVSGRVATVEVGEGDAVEAGAELAQIDAAAQLAVLRQAVAGLDAALVAEQEAVSTFSRTEALGENAARSVLENAQRAVQAAAQEVARMTALVDHAQIQLEDFTIRAPMAGTVLALEVEPGESVDPATVLLTLADLSHLVVETDVDEAYASQVRNGLPAVLQLAGETSLREGRVSFVSQRVDSDTGGLAVEVAFDEAVSAPVGLTATINIIVDRQEAAITVPRTAIRTGDDDAAVFVVEDGVATRRAVEVIDWPAARLVVTDGVTPGDTLVIDATDIVEGQPVRAEQD